MASRAKAAGLNVVASNRKALHEYDVLETYEAGIVLVGTEVKALREGRANLTGAYGKLVDGEVFLEGAEISEYVHGNRQNHVPKARRKLLLNRHEIRKIATRTRERGFTLVPLKIYFKGSRAKVELAVARGRKLHDRRQATAKREAQREIQRAERQRR